MTAHTKLVQYINEAHALETTLVQTLTAHIAVTPAGPYRDLLERHRDETRAQATALEDRLSEIGATRSPIAMGVGLLEAAAGQGLALAKAPIDLLRGTGGEEKLLKNAKDEIASEALEIATYDALEALATALGDAPTAQLAREHRAQEEEALAELRALIPALTVAVVASDVARTDVYDPTTTGAADAVRGAAEGAAATARKATRGAARTAAKGVRQTAAGVEEVADTVEDTAEEVRDSAAGVQEAATDTPRTPRVSTPRTAGTPGTAGRPGTAGTPGTARNTDTPRRPRTPRAGTSSRP